MVNQFFESRNWEFVPKIEVLIVEDDECIIPSKVLNISCIKSKFIFMVLVLQRNEKKNRAPGGRKRYNIGLL